MSDLTPDEIRTLLYESSLVVRPGETLIVQVPADWTAVQVLEYQEYLDGWFAENAPSIKGLVVAGDQLGKAAGLSLAERVRTLTSHPGGRRG